MAPEGSGDESNTWIWGQIQVKTFPPVVCQALERVTQSTVNPLPLSDFGVVFSSG